MRHFVFLILLSSSLLARSFTVAVYNVENLFDIDGKAIYEEYQAPKYGAAHLKTKVTNIAEVIAHMGEGAKGPDIILFQEVEVDQTPSPAAEVAKRYEAISGKKLSQLLIEPVAKELADLPAEAWLLKAFEERGLKGYTAVVGGDSALEPHEDGHGRPIKCMVFTKLPVKAVRNHPIKNARNIVEVQIEVEGHPLYIFANHWKSGAGDAVTERIRVANARVLKARVDELLRTDPQTDIIIGGDFNSQYNQKQRYPEMKETGMNDVLGSQGDVLAIRGPLKALYNLWYEVPAAERGSDVFRGEWGTLMQLIISRGLYDFRGIQYVDHSYKVVRLPGINMEDDGTPKRWTFNGPAGTGYSDHFPLIATFTTVEDNKADRWLDLKNPSDGMTPAQGPKVNYSVGDLSKKAKRLAELPKGYNLRDGSHNGKLFHVSGKFSAGQRLQVAFAGEEWDLYFPDPKLRERVMELWRNDETVRFYGELGQYRGRWQFVVKDAAWLQVAE